MGAWLDRWTGLLLNTGLATGLFLGVVATAMVACRQPARRCWLARLGVLGTLAIGPLSGSGLMPRVDLAGPFFASVPPSWSVLNGRQQFPSKLLPRSLTATYLAGVSLGMATLVLGWWGVSRIEAGATEPSESSRALYDEVCAQSGAGPTRPRFRISGRLSRPALLGMVRPLIVVPPDLDRPEARTTLRLGLLHELAHARRRDHQFAQLAAWAQVLAFPWPQSWWIGAQLRLDQEYLTDRLAASVFGTRRAYAASLVALATPGPSATEPASADPVPTPNELGSRIFRRVLMLVHCPFPIEPTPPAAWRILVAILTFAGTLAASGLTVRAIPPPRPDFPPHGTFRMSRLVLRGEVEGHPPHREPFRFPLGELPPPSELLMDAWAETPASLAHSRIFGLTLAPGLVQAPSWHKLRILQEPGYQSLWLDGQQVHDRLPTPPTGPDPTFQPAPGRTAEFRDLRLSW